MAESESQPPASHTITTPAQQDTSGSERTVPSSIPPVPPHVPPPPPQQRYTHACKPDQTPWWKVILEVAALIAVIAYTIAAWQQLGVMGGQLSEMQKSTKAAHEAAYIACVSAQIARGTLLEIQSGGLDTHSAAVGTILQAVAVTRGEAAQLVVVYESLKAGTDVDITFPFQIKNVGKTVAKNVKAVYEPSVLDVGKEPNFRYSAKSYNHGEIGAQNPGDESGTIPNYVWDGDNRVKYSVSNMKNFGDAKAYLSIYGKITYSDIFGVKHWTTFCNHRFGVVASVYGKCAAYNQTDSNKAIESPKSIPKDPDSIPKVTCVDPNLK
jgi:hypothetical protein